MILSVRFGTHVSGGCPVFRSVRLNNPTPFDIRLDWEIYNQVKDDKKLVDLLMFFGDPFPPKDMDKNETASNGSNSESEIALKLDQPPNPCGSVYPALQTTDESSDTDSEEITQEPTVQKIVSVLIRPHEGVAANNPYSITPRQIVVPGGGSISVCISFTPHVLPESGTEAQCGGFVLGFMSLDDELAKTVPDKVNREHGYDAPPLRIDLRASVRHALLKVDMAHDGGMMFYSMASDLIPDQPLSGVKVSFHTTLELLTYQHLPDTQMLPGFQVLQFENGERKLKFSQNLVIEHSNHSTQLVPVTAYLTVPVLELSCDMLDFKTCFVAQTKTEHVFLSNRSGCRSYWAALLDEQERHNNDLEVFSVSPPNGILEAREGDQPTKDVLQITFTARKDIEYEAVVTITGMLGEKPCKLQLRGRGSYDGKYEDLPLI